MVNTISTQTPTNSQTQCWWSKGLLIVISVFIFCTSVFLCLVDFKVWRAEQLLKPLISPPYMAQNLHQLSAVENAFISSSEAIPVSGRYHELLARSLLIKHTLIPKSVDVDSIIQLHRNAINARPFWPISHANFAYAKQLNGQFDEEYRRAIIDAAKLGPWEPYVILKTLKSASAGWPHLTTAEKQAVVTLVENGLSLERKNISTDILVILKQSADTQAYFCNVLKFSSERIKQRWCRR